MQHTLSCCTLTVQPELLDKHRRGLVIIICLFVLQKFLGRSVKIGALMLMLHTHKERESVTWVQDRQMEGGETEKWRGEVTHQSHSKSAPGTDPRLLGQCSPLDHAVSIVSRVV